MLFENFRAFLLQSLQEKDIAKKTTCSYFLDMPHDPIAEWEAFQKTGAEKKAAAIAALKETLKLTKKKLASLQGKRKKSGYVMTDKHKKKIQAALKKRAAKAKPKRKKPVKRAKVTAAPVVTTDAN